jgi:two-component system, OmpR family, response regulator ChvI
MQSSSSSSSSNFHNKNKKKKKILFVEDEVDLTFMFKMALEDVGLFKVDTFNDPQLALKNFRPDSYDLVILDIKMPKMDGLQLYKQLKKLDPDVRICFLTGMGESDYEEQLRKEGEGEERPACYFDKDLLVKKPVSVEELLKEIEKRMK